MITGKATFKKQLQLLFTNPFKARLSRKIAFWVFTGLLLIEVVILIPSYQKREQDLLLEIEKVGQATIKPWVSLQQQGVDPQILEDLKKSIVFDSYLLGAEVFLPNGQPIAKFGESPELEFVDLSEFQTIRQLSQDGKTYDVVWSPATLGVDQYTVIVRLDSSSVGPNKRAYILRIVGLILLICATVTLVTMMALVSLVLQPILRLRTDLLNVGTAIDQDQPTPAFQTNSLHVRDELGEVVQTFHLMVDQIYQAIQDRKRTEQELQDLNQNLSHTLETLQNTQASLVEAEKMAALGHLVAGVAHEINTPIGTSITVASTLADETELFLQATASGQLKRSVLTRYIDVVRRCSLLIDSNLERAGDLVQSFKKVAVDQSHQELRTFNLKAYMQEVVTSLHPQVKSSGHQLQVTGEDSIVLTNDPGVFAQVITNLVTNSIKHAYPNGKSGQLELQIVQQDHQIMLIYRDDGCGIPAAHLSKVYEPFFTTARHQGGTGLGLNIVYNIVCQSLQGAIDIDSQEGQGTTITIVLPTDGENHA